MPRPRRDRGSSRLARFQPLARLLAFTAIVCLLVAGSVALLYGTLTLASRALDTRTASFLALFVFAVSIALPVYVLSLRETDSASGDGPQS